MRMRKRYRSIQRGTTREVTLSFLNQKDTPHSFRGLLRWAQSHGYTRVAHVGDLYHRLGLSSREALYYEIKRLKKRFPTRSSNENKSAAVENLEKWGFIYSKKK